MKKEVRVLILEDDPSDVFRLTMELRHGGVNFVSQHVYDRDGFRKALDKEIPDIILSDQGLPSFDGHTALQIAREKCPQVPFIVVTGAYNQETAVEMLMNGAADYIYKGNLTDLVPAVRQALQEAQVQVAKPAPEEVAAFVLPTPPIDQAPAQEAPPVVPVASGASLFLCPRCQQLTDETGSPQSLTRYVVAHDQANVVSAVCPNCAYQFPSG